MTAPSSLYTVFDASYRALAGQHRIQRVPGNDKQGRRQSSNVTVVWLNSGDFPSRPGAEGRSSRYEKSGRTAQREVSTSVDTPLDRRDVREEFIRTSGRGGQRKNKVSTGVRLLHVPSGVQVIEDGRHQAQNREKAWARLEAILSDQERQVKQNELDQVRRDSFAADRSFTWTQWRNEVKRSDGVKASYASALRGRIGSLMK